MNTNVCMYVCGPTVYDHSHVGHARVYMTVDIINRIMNQIQGINTFIVMNITDIDDKIIDRAKDTNTDWQNVAETYTKSFFNSMAKINVGLPDYIIRVSEVLPEIVEYIQVILDKGFAYVTEDASVYFDTEAYVNAGYDTYLVESDDYSGIDEKYIQQKKHKKDFALWKGRGTNDVAFDVEFIHNEKSIKSRGRPGWHIECSAMIHQTIGPNIDIHFGGIDLKSIHHQNERIQAHAYYHPQFSPNIPWVKKFIHIGHLCNNNQKILL